MDTIGKVVLELYVRGQSTHSMAAVELVRRVCESHLHSRYRLDVIDISQQPERVPEASIRATPALVRRSPGPVLRITGRLTEARVLEGLGIPPQSV